MKARLKRLYSAIENRLSPATKTTIGVVAVAAVAYSGLTLISGKNDTTRSSVMITNVAGNSGGTGVIYASSDTSSLVLTNRHVCEVARKGGFVRSQNGNFLVKSIRPSETHDICMVKVVGNLGTSTKIASRPPRSFYEFATISGHPSLLPNVVTSGHFSGRQSIEVLTGFRRCTNDELSKDPFTCLLLGGYPIVRRYDSVLVTATIMPGSSGSGVYNSDNELSGLAFAGNRGIGYAWTVPYEYLHYFLDTEYFWLEEIAIDNNVLHMNQEEEEHTAFNNRTMKNFRRTCSNESSWTTVMPTITTEQVATAKHYCGMVVQGDYLWSEQ